MAIVVKTLQPRNPGEIKETVGLDGKTFYLGANVAVVLGKSIVFVTPEGTFERPKQKQIIVVNTDTGEQIKVEFF